MYPQGAIDYMTEHGVVEDESEAFEGTRGEVWAVEEEEGGAAAAEAPDWSILENETVDRVLHQAANKIARTFAGVTTADDQHQEGSIWLASNAALVRQHLSDKHTGARALYRRLHDRLFDGVKTDAAHSNQSVPYHSFVESELSSE